MIGVNATHRLRQFALAGCSKLCNRRRNEAQVREQRGRRPWLLDWVCAPDFSLFGPANKDRFAVAHGDLPDVVKPFDAGVGYQRSRHSNVRLVTQEKKSLTLDGFMERRRIAYGAY